MKLVFECAAGEVRFLLEVAFRERLAAALKSPVEGFQVQFPVSLRHGSAHGVPQRLTVEHLRDGSKKPYHHDVEYHLLAEFFRDAGCGDAVNPHSCGQLANPHQVLFDDENAFVLELRSEQSVSRSEEHTSEL